MGFHGVPDEEGRAEVGFDLVEGARGRGYASEALTALSDWALARDDVHTLRAVVEAANLPSQAVATRAGYVRAPQGEQDLEEQGMDEQDTDGALQLYIRR